MSGVPFGFGKSSDDPDDPRMDFTGADNPFAALFGGGPGTDPNALANMFTQLGQMMQWTGGPVNWDLATDTARKTVAAAGSDPSVSDTARREIDEAVRLAELWLDPTTTLPSSGAAALAWSRAEWIAATVPVWRSLVDPVAEKVVGSMGEVLPAEMAAQAGPLVGMMRQMGGAMFGAQVGQALGTLAGEILGASDIGLPLGPAGRPALVAANVAAFSEGLGVPPSEVRLYLAMREAAHQRLFAGVSWLRGHVLSAVQTYANGISIDMSRIESVVSDLDPTNPEAISRALSEGMFTPQQTPAQEAALARLETLLALIEGWVDEVVNAAAVEHLSPASASALRESLRRRRAAGGPAEQTFGNLIGLELRPRRLREAAALWQELRVARGVDGRDAVWEHPDLLPSGPDLDDPSAFVHPVELDFGSLLDPPADPPADNGEK
ncbi:MAG: zinc-dependent metalloprotease [Sporichthyaceae bacterium]